MKLLRDWTIGRASGVGAVAGLAALVLWPAYASWQEPVRPAFISALAVSVFCGLSILVITALDRRRHGPRGERLRPVRWFDIALALLLAVPSLLALESLW